MKCHLCSNPAEIKCSCSPLYLCSSHLGSHLINTEPHQYERLIVPLTQSKSELLNFELLTRLSQIKTTKNTLSSLSTSLIRTLKSLTKISIQKLDKLAENFLLLLNREKFSESEILQTEKIINTKLKKSKIGNIQIGEDLEKVFKQEFFKEITTCEWRKKKFLKKHSGGFKCGVITEDKLKLVTGAEDCLVRVWNLCDGKNLMTLKGHTSYVWCIDLAPGSVVVASGGLDGTVRVWSLELGIQISMLLAHSGPVFCVQFVNQEQILSAGFACSVILWDYNKNNFFKEITKTEALIFALIIFKNKSEYLCGSGKNICFYSINSKKLIKCFKGHKQSVKCLVLSDSEETLLSGSNDKTILAWSMRTYSILFSLNGHLGAINSIKLTVNNENIISVSDDSTIRIWSIQAKNQIAQFSDHLTRIYKIIPYNENFLILSHDASISTLNLSNSTLQKQYPLKPWIVKSESLSTDKKYLYYSTGTSACIYNLQKNTLDSTLMQETLFISCIDISHNKKFAIFGLKSTKENLILWDLEKNIRSQVFQGHLKSVSCVHFKYQEEIFASGSSDKTVRIWNIANQNQVTVLEGHSDIVNTLKFTKSNFFLVSAGKDKKIIVWDYSNASIFFILNGHNQSIWTLEMTFDDEFIVSADSYEGIRVWSLQNKRQEHHFTKFNSAENWLKDHKIELEHFRTYLLF